MRGKRGFTLIEMLVVIGIIAILAAIVLIAVNPGRQFAQARDSQRRSDLYSITNAIYQYAVDHNGNLPANITATPTHIGTGSLVNLSNNPPGNPYALVPTYIADIPYDPSVGTPADTQYTIFLDTNGRIVATASGEIATTITVQR